MPILPLSQTTVPHLLSRLCCFIALLSTKHYKYPCIQNPYSTLLSMVHGKFMCMTLEFLAFFSSLSYIQTHSLTNAISFDSLKFFSLLLTLRMPHQILVTSNNAVPAVDIFSLSYFCICILLPCTYDHVMNEL